MGYKPF